MIMTLRIQLRLLIWWNLNDWLLKVAIYGSQSNKTILARWKQLNRIDLESADCNPCGYQMRFNCRDSFIIGDVEAF